MRIKYHRQIVDMLYQEWNLGKAESGARGKICAWIYWFDILSEAERVIVKRQDSHAIGVCGYSKWNSKKHLLRKRFYSILAKLLMRSPRIKNKQALQRYLNNYDYTPKRLEHHFDGEVAIIIVEKEQRGRGLGAKMLSEIFELARNDGVHNLQILTDESCNFGFYEKMGCRKVYEKTITNGEADKCGIATTEQGFIYEKTFS